MLRRFSPQITLLLVLLSAGVLTASGHPGIFMAEDERGRAALAEGVVSSHIAASEENVDGSDPLALLNSARCLIATAYRDNDMAPFLYRSNCARPPFIPPIA